MLDTITLDQLRMFAAVAEHGSFSAAARALQRVQSALSHGLANLEAQLDVKLFDRRTRIPTLTAEGHALLAHARSVLAEADTLRAAARGLTAGLEASVRLAVDAVYPLDALTKACVGFAKRFPTVGLQLHTETMDAVAHLVRQGVCSLGVVGPAARTQGLSTQPLAVVRMVPVVAARHPLAAHKGVVPHRLLEAHVQVVLGERGDPAATPAQGVLSSRTWRVIDLPTKHALLRAGLGWGNLPEHLVTADLKRRALKVLRPQGWTADQHRLQLSACWRPAEPPGPATRWLTEQLETLCRQEVRRTG